jgi:hypothetical protein
MEIEISEIKAATPPPPEPVAPKEPEPVVPKEPEVVVVPKLMKKIRLLPPPPPQKKEFQRDKVCGFFYL